MVDTPRWRPSAQKLLPPPSCAYVFVVEQAEATSPRHLKVLLSVCLCLWPERHSFRHLLPARQSQTHLHNFGDANRVGGPLEAPLLQETADDVDGFLDLRSETCVWQEVVFDELVPLIGLGISELLLDAQAEMGETVVACKTR